MTDIEKKALALVNEVMFGSWLPHEVERIPYFPAVCRAIEQHEAFRQEVSDALVEYFGEHLVAEDGGEPLARFIIAKPDSLVAVIATALREGSPFCEDGSHSYMDEAKVVAAAIKKRGGKIVWEND